jgi:hypothetical protein
MLRCLIKPRIEGKQVWQRVSWQYDLEYGSILSDEQSIITDFYINKIRQPTATTSESLRDSFLGLIPTKLIYQNYSTFRDKNVLKL